MSNIDSPHSPNPEGSPPPSTLLSPDLPDPGPPPSHNLKYYFEDEMSIFLVSGNKISLLPPSCLLLGRKSTF
jgi:hypothetical protein